MGAPATALARGFPKVKKILDRPARASLRAQEVGVGDLILGAAFYNILDMRPFQYIKIFFQILETGQG
jgi:hypothetical protein